MDVSHVSNQPVIDHNVQLTVPESTEGYRETPPKRVAQCNDCHASSSVGDVVKIEIQRPFVITNFDIDNSDEEEEDEKKKKKSNQQHLFLA